MAIKNIGVIKKFIGLSGDVKPTDSSITAASRFFESDTGADYIYTGAAWVAYTSISAAQIAKLNNITVTQAVDLDTIETNSNASKVKTDFIAVTQAVNLDTMESDLLNVTSASYSTPATVVSPIFALASGVKNATYKQLDVLGNALNNRGEDAWATDLAGWTSGDDSIDAATYYKLTKATSTTGERDVFAKFDVTKNYLVTIYGINASDTAGAHFDIINGTGGADIKASTTLTVTQSLRIGLILQASDMTGKVPFLQMSHVGSGSVKFYQFFIQEISTAEYAEGLTVCMNRYNYRTQGTKGSAPQEVLSTGKNLFDGLLETGTIDAAGVNAVDATRVRGKNYIPVFSNTSYTPKDFTNTPGGLVAMRYYNINKSLISYENTASAAPITTPVNCRYVRIVLVAVTNINTLFQLELGSAATTYEAYKSSKFYTPALYSVPAIQDKYDALSGLHTVNTMLDADISGADYVSIVKGTDTTHLTMVAHGLVTGDIVENTTRSAATGNIVTVISADNMTHASVAAQVATDTIKKYAKQANGAAGVDTTETAIKIDTAGFTTGDFIRNTTRANTIRQVTVTDAATLTVTAITGQVATDVIERYFKSGADDTAEVGIDYVITAAFALMKTATTGVDLTTRHYDSAGLELSEIAFASITLAASAGKYATTTDNKIYACTTGGTYADIAAARIGLGTRSLRYQLATPTYTTREAIPPESFENGTLSTTPRIRDTCLYNAAGDGFTATDTTNPIVTLVQVYKQAGSVQTDIAISTCTVAAGGLTFTSTALATGDTVVAIYDTLFSNTTVPTITHSEAVNVLGMAEMTSVGLNLTKKVLDDFLVYQNAVNLEFDARITAVEPA